MPFPLTHLLCTARSFPGIERAHAAFDTFKVSGWAHGDVTWGKILESILEVLTVTAAFVACAVFVYGAFMLSIAAGKADLADKGKNYMKDALIGFAVVVGAQAILRTASCFIWGCEG
ncbi:MAG: hypothetical protein PHE68_04160 [Candidatus Peribacteraceae bacterium]|nr:hypothetical protein [Candidatus Peribacteraceae bacterium]MDD5075263.1 hypothetical protein [Candidatus Peribacteraceae bacterium]